ncbi:MAG: hypothetical protein AAF609_13625 [Cyanobacteria bacterium P01_C01_bin.120]
MHQIYALKRWLNRRLKLFYYHHFAVIPFVSITLLLAIGLSFLEQQILWPAYTVAALLWVAIVVYYGLYFKEYQNLIDAYTQGEYYLTVFSFWGIVFYNILFVCCFAFIWVCISTGLTIHIFQNLEYKDIVILLFEAVIDGGTFGLLDSFDLSLCQLPNCNLGRGIFGQIYQYTTSVVIDIAFWASVTGEILGWLEADRAVAILMKTGKIEDETPSTEQIKKIQVFCNLYRKGRIDVIKHEDVLIHIMKISRTKDARNIFLEIMQRTNNMFVLKACLDYFKDVPDRRFSKVCKTIKHYEKRRIIEEFEFRRVKKQPWRGRPQKPAAPQPKHQSPRVLGLNLKLPAFLSRKKSQRP